MGNSKYKKFKSKQRSFLQKLLQIISNYGTDILKEKVRVPFQKLFCKFSKDVTCSNDDNDDSNADI